MRFWLAWTAFWVGWVAFGASLLLRPVLAAPAPLVQVGQVYLVVESCSTSTGKCFGELHRVTQMLEGQWVETKQCADENCSQTGQMWRINLARVYALRPYRGPNSHDAF